jgi:hypothetical protein
MRPRPRLRKTAKWVGVLVCAVIAGVLAASYRWSAAAALDRETGLRRFVSLLYINKAAVSYVSQEVQPHHLRLNIHPEQPTGFRAEVSRAFSGAVWRPHVESRPGWTQVSLPLWLPLLLIAIPTALLWRRDHILTKRAKAGRCSKCGYDRAGLAQTKPCPECGERN